MRTTGLWYRKTVSQPLPGIPRRQRKQRTNKAEKGSSQVLVVWASRAEKWGNAPGIIRIWRRGK